MRMTSMIRLPLALLGALALAGCVSSYGYRGGYGGGHGDYYYGGASADYYYGDYGYGYGGYGGYGYGPAYRLGLYGYPYAYYGYPNHYYAPRPPYRPPPGNGNGPQRPVVNAPSGRYPGYDRPRSEVDGRNITSHEIVYGDGRRRTVIAPGPAAQGMPPSAAPIASGRLGALVREAPASGRLGPTQRQVAPAPESRPVGRTQGAEPAAAPVRAPAAVERRSAPPPQRTRPSGRERVID